LGWDPEPFEEWARAKRGMGLPRDDILGPTSSLALADSDLTGSDFLYHTPLLLLDVEPSLGLSSTSNTKPRSQFYSNSVSKNNFNFYFIFC
jgi:hypothetical protein